MARREKLKLVSEKPHPLFSSDYMLDDQIGFRLRIAMQRHTSIFASKMADDLTQTQFAALAKLREVGACSQNHLGRLIFLDASTIKGVVDRLRLRALVTICADPNDKRRRAVDLTDKGRRVTEDAISAAGDITRVTLAPLSSAERRQVVELLKRLS